MYTFLLLGIESSLREKWRLLKSKLEEKNKGSDKGKPRVRLSQSPFPVSAGLTLRWGGVKNGGVRSVVG